MIRKGLLAIVFLLCAIFTSSSTDVQARTWTTEVVDAPKYFSNFYSRAIAVDSNKQPHIAYGGDHLYYAYNNGSIWNHITVDSSPGVGEYASIAIDSSGKVHISYYDSINRNLKYATNITGSWTIATVDSSGDVGKHTCVAVDSSNKVHISYSSGNLKYATNITGSWITQTIDESSSVTYNTSLAIDLSRNVHISYIHSGKDLKYITNATDSWLTETLHSGGDFLSSTSLVVNSLGNVHISYVDCTNFPETNFMYITNVTGHWEKEIIDGPGVVGFFTSIALDSSGNVHIAYECNYQYQYVLRYANNITGSWQTITSDSSTKHYAYISIALDPSDNAYISYYDSSNADLKYATNTSGSWIAASLDNSGDVGSSNSIAIDSAGHTHISYYDSSNHEIKYATNVTGSWVIESVYFSFHFHSLSLAIDSLGNVHISFVDSYHLKYATNTSGSWVIESVDSNANFTSPSITIDSSDKAHISYYGGDIYSYNVLKYATNCTGSWVIESIETFASFSSGSSIALDSSGNVHIAYQDLYNTGLKYATNLTGSWVTYVVDSNDYAGYSYSLALDSSDNVHISYKGSGLKYATNTSGVWILETVDEVAHCASMALDTSDNAHMSYYDSANGDLKYATNAMGYWMTEAVDSSGDVVGLGRHCSIALDSSGNVHISYYDAFLHDLKHATSPKLSVDIYVDQIYGNNANDGLMWATAKSTIQDGIDLAESQGCGKVHVASGTYVENITIGSNIELFGGFPAGGGPRDILSNVTTIDGNGNGNTVIMDNGKGINGFTIRGGTSYKPRYESGGGILCCGYGSLKIIENCRIIDNNANNGSGGGVYIAMDKAIIRNCVISKNSASNSGGGISYANGTYPTIENCVISRNTALIGAGVYGYEYSAITNCTIVDNAAINDDAGGGIQAHSSHQTITNCIIWGNSPKQITNTSTPTYTCIQDSSYLYGQGNIADDPKLEVDGYHLKAGSPCINAGLSEGSPENDIDNEIRPYDISVDMGADERIDSDSDSLPDYWEYQWFGNLSLDGTSDPDSDGVRNSEEYQYGTAPDDPDDHPIDGFVFVDGENGDDYNYGCNWAHAKQTIQAAIEAATAGDTILVKDGEYTGPGNKNLDFLGKAIILRSENGPENTIIDCENDGRGFYFSHNETSLSVVEGFTITNGHDDETGGGMYMQNASPTIIDCIFSGNSASYGGAIRCTSSSPTIANCTISGNQASYGGGIGCWSDSSPTITNCTISDNTATEGWGGGIFLSASSPDITDCIVCDNTAVQGGGIECTDGSSPTIFTCTIKGNQASGNSGGIHCYRSASPVIINSIIIGNQAAYGAAIGCQDYAEPRFLNCTITDNQADNYCGGVYNFGYPAWPTVTNCILWGNTSPEVRPDLGTVTITYCDIDQDGYAGSDGNIRLDPLFLDPGNNDFRLQANSPCIDTGLNVVPGIYSDKRGSLRPLDGDSSGLPPHNTHNDFDMGAYEYSATYGGLLDAVTKAFKNVRIDISNIITNYPYEIKWSNKFPFPNNDLRITGNGEYSVRRLLVGEDGRSIALDTFTVPSQEPVDGYSEPFTFTEEHIGTWFIRIELADDPNQFEISENTITIERAETDEWVVGDNEGITPPSGADTTQKPLIDPAVEDAFLWHNNTLYAVSPVTAIVTWYTSEGGTIYVEGTNAWPTDPQIHVADSVPVDLLPDGSNYSEVQLKYNTNDSLIDVNRFTASEDGYTVLIYWEDGVEDGPLLFEVVKTVRWNDPDHFREEDWDIGDEITSQDHDPVCGNGYVFNEFSTYAANTESEEPYDGYDRASRTGPIVPVNLDYDSETTDDDLLVVWYEKGITGACWPYKPVRYNPEWPVPAGPEDKIIIAKKDGTGNQFVEYSSVRIHNQPDPVQAGFNPNEEHALIVGDTVFALRDDLNRSDTSLPYVLVKFQDPENGNRWGFNVFEVIAEEDPDFFHYDGNASSLIQAPYPLSVFPVCEESYGLPGGPWWEDYKGNLWARKDGTGILRFYYPLQEGFFYDDPDKAVGTCIPWLDRRPGGTEGVPVDVTYNISWPNAPELHVGETLIEPKNGLPDIRNQCSVEIIYDQSGDNVKLMEVLSEREVYLDLDALPAEIKTKEIESSTVVFPDLPPHLTKGNRVSYDCFNHKLKFKGVFDDSGVGENPILLLNIMSERDRNFIANLDENLDCPEFQAAVAALFTVTREHLSGETEIVGTAVFKALTAAAPTGGSGGYVTLAFNNNEEFCDGNTVGLSVIKVDCVDLYAGELKFLEPENVFDERMTFVHSGDFAGEPDNLIFEWKYSISTDEPEPPTDENPGPWFDLVVEGHGITENDVTIGGSGIQTIQDKWITCRYRGYQRCDGPTVWSEWTDPQLYKNWVYRVMDQIGPFEQRCDDFHEPGGEVATYVSMIEQAGKRYEGDVALNDDPDYLNSLGLIEFYETLLKRAKELSIDGTPSVDDEVANNAILLATSRLADLYMLLGNEAYADASDPTIGYTTESDVGTAAPSIFCFQNQMASLLQEELELLRGRDDSRNPDIDISPFYNRAIWNFTSGYGELAYTMNYAVDTEEEAMTMFPQGHGDAWGHYLTGIKKYYALLRHEKFTWLPRPETVRVAGADVEVDYLDERKFAAAAAAKARTGAEIVNLTYRDKYVDDPSGQWQGYKDDDDVRAWGLSEWATRAGQGAYFDWVVGNALLPDEDTNPEHTGIQKIDRRTVTELSEVASRFSEIQSELDKADMGLNPLGIAKDAIPFDITPSEVDAGKTHFEQIYERAVQSLNNAIVVFDHANQHSQMLRRQQDALEDFQNNVEDRGADFNNRLIEIFGYPYDDDIGLGCVYPSGYDGPDIYHYFYVDPSVLMGIQPPPVIEFSVTVTDFLDVDASGGLVEQTRVIPFHVSAEGFGFIKHPEWTGSRRAPGEIQMARSDLIQTKARFERALVEYNNLLAQIEGEAELLQAQYNMNAEQISIMYGAQGKQQSLNSAIFSARKRQLTYRTTGRMATIVANAIAEGFPRSMGIIVGLANGTIADWTSALRSAVMMAGTVVNETMSQMADAQSLNELAVQQAKEIVQSQSSIELTALQSNFAIEQKLKQIAQLIRSEASLRLELFTLQENIQQASGRYLSTLARGERLLEDRTRYRKQVADDILEYRHKDMAFRIFRNDALQKYRAQFDLGARYVYLAAKAYDYDTCLLDSSTRAGEQFMTNIVRQRTIGLINGGSPIIGSGLADPMAEMVQNFTELKSDMGFNNPQLEENRFSLREELFRTKSGLASNDQWKGALMRTRIANLWDIPEFRRYCNRFAGDTIIEPAIVIPFSTNITSRLNFFGWPLGGGDSFYSAANFATKVRGVGVWFENYDNANLAETPRVYLVPVGEDIIRSPYSDSFATRAFKVVDQFLPLPYILTSVEVENAVRGWIPIFDTQSGGFFNIRKHAPFKAFHDSSNWKNDIQYDACLIGRSVWNTEWLLIIPGASLLGEPDEGLDIFIDTITDIKFLFETYSYKGGLGVSAEEDEPEAEDGTAAE